MWVWPILLSWRRLLLAVDDVGSGAMNGGDAKVGKTVGKFVFHFSLHSFSFSLSLFIGLKTRYFLTFEFRILWGWWNVFPSLSRFPCLSIRRFVDRETFRLQFFMLRSVKLASQAQRNVFLSTYGSRREGRGEKWNAKSGFEIELCFSHASQQNPSDGDFCESNFLFFGELEEI